MIERTIDYVFGVIWITMLTLQNRNPSNMGVVNCLGHGGLHSPSAHLEKKISKQTETKSS